MGGTRKGSRLLSGRWHAHLDGGFIFGGLAETNSVSELGVLYGVLGRYRWFDGAISIGPSWVSKTTHPGMHSDEKKKSESTVGVMLGGEVTLALGRSFAMGFQGYGGVSSLDTLWGIGWVLKFGKLRPG